MLIPFDKIVNKYGVRPKGILHLGANIGEEAEAYAKHGIKPIVWVEANPETFSILMQRVTNLSDEHFNNDQLFFCNFCVGDEDGKEVTFHVSNNGSQSSSILELGTHKKQHPSVHYVNDIAMKITRVDTIFERLKEAKNEHGYNCFHPELFDYVSLDLQGAELLALRGMGDLLRQFKWVYSEVNKNDVYVGCAHVNDIDLFLNGFGFKRVVTEWCGNWGDALYIKR